MSKVFDEWMNYIEENGQGIIELEFQLVLDMNTALDKTSEDLRDWLNEESKTSFLEKISGSTNAIRHSCEL